VSWPPVDPEGLEPDEAHELAVLRLMARGWGRDEAELRLLREAELAEEVP
jgi:hypothetical protein